MFAVERMNNIVLFWVNLVLDIEVLFNEINKLLHLLAEQAIDMERELFPKGLNPV